MSSVNRRCKPLQIRTGVRARRDLRKWSGMNRSELVNIEMTKGHFELD